MAIQKFDKDLNIISKLSDYPSEDGLETDAFKAKFDLGPNLLKEYINNVLIPEISKTVDEDTVKAEANAYTDTAKAEANAYTDTAKAEANAYTDTAKAEANAYTDASVRKAAPRNLLDNSDFRNPVNQRGVTTTNDWAYCIDRWISRRTGMSLQNTRDGLTITSANTDSYIYQRISNPEKLLGKKCTAAVCEGNGNITITSFTFPDSIPTDWTAIADNTEGNIRLYIFGINDLSVGVGLNDTVNEATIKWVALYEGEYTAETLPEYQPKGYGAELLECQRYYYRRNLLCVLHLVNKSNLVEYRGEITFPVEMRTNPQCAFDQNEGNVAIGLVNNQLCLLTGTPNELGWCTTGSRLEFIADL